MGNDYSINAEKVVRHWIASSDEDFVTMEGLLAIKRNCWALFLGHIVLEKLLKAYYVKQCGRHAPLTHDLLQIAQRSGIDITEEQAAQLDTITTFNINARYDNYKQNFYAVCTPEYTLEWADTIKQLRLWIKEML